MIVVGGEPNAVSYTDAVEIIDVTDDAPEISIHTTQSLPLTLNYFQLMSVFDDSYVCTVGGQCIVSDIAKVDDRIFCAKVLSTTTTPGPTPGPTTGIFHFFICFCFQKPKKNQ